MHIRFLAAVALGAALPGCSLASAGDPDLDPALEAGLTTVDAFRALRTANTASAATMQSGALLSAIAANNIVAARAGADHIDGTADDRPFYTVAALDAVPSVDIAAINLLASYGRAHAELFGPMLRTNALPPELAGDVNASGMIRAMASDTSLMVDGDATTFLSSEWELGTLFAHHFVQGMGARVARIRGYVFASDVRFGPFIDIATLAKTIFGEGEPSWALAALLRRTAVDPRHTVGRIYAPELQAALADANFVAQFPGINFVADRYLAIWNANVQIGDPGDLPPGRAWVRALLQSRGVPVFTAPYPADRQIPVEFATAPVAMPFPPGTEIMCMQGNNSMAANSSHGPDQLRYSLDLNAPLGTTLAAAASGTAYVYAHARPNSFDNFGFGNILLIDLHNGYAFLHAHVNTFAVVNGQEVTAGQTVGTIGVTGAAGPEPHVHFEVVRLFRTPDPANEEYQSDTPIGGHETPFGSPEPFLLRTIDLTAGSHVAQAIRSYDIICGESGYLPGSAHVYRTP